MSARPGPAFAAARFAGAKAEVLALAGSVATGAALLGAALLGVALPGVALLAARDAEASPNVCGPGLVRALGPGAQRVFAPGRDVLGAVVTLPPGADAKALGLTPLAPGFARLHASPAALVAFADKHPDLPIELAPPLRPLLDKAGRWIRTDVAHERGATGKGVLVGVADTGLDVTLGDFKDPVTGKSRVAWMLDLSLPPAGIHPQLEAQFCIQNASGACQSGAVLSGADIDRLIAKNATASIPVDEDGHGTHVTSIAAGNGGAEKKYVGGAPDAQIVFARITRGASESIVNDDVLTGISFLFDRASAMGLPIAANLSLGSDFGPHDGSMAWERAMAAFVGDSQPGRALVVAAGNSGSIALTPVHQTVHVSSGSTLSVPILTEPVDTHSDVEVWVTMTAGSEISVGLDGPDGTWVSPVDAGENGSKSASGYQATVANGSAAKSACGNVGVYDGCAVPQGSEGAVVVWTATGAAGWPAGTYSITLSGEGTADLWVESSSSRPDGSTLGFAYGVREGTINLPATHPGLIAVGCTVNRTGWTSIDDAGLFLPETPGLDPMGGLPEDGGVARFTLGGECWFSSAGPNVLGVPKPEIAAPGSFVIGAMSSEAAPGSQESIFTSPDCPPLTEAGAPDPRCFQVDTGHAVAEGTSMSAPMVTGAVALILQRDRTLTETELVPILQGGAHFFRSGRLHFEDQGGPGELDVMGSFAVMDAMTSPQVALPAPETTDDTKKHTGGSWMTLSSDLLLADGSTPLVAIFELRSAFGEPADLFEASRLAAFMKVDDFTVDPPPRLVRKGPGVWTFSLLPNPGFGGSRLTVGATFDGAPLVAERTIPIATDPWTASYPSGAAGSGCSVSPGRGALSARGGGAAEVGGGVLGILLARRRRRRRRSYGFSPATATTHPCGSGASSFGS